MGKKKKKKKWNGMGRPPRGAPPESSEADLKALYGEGYESPAPGELDVARSQRAGVARKRRLDRMRRAAASDRAIPARAVTTEAWSDLESEEIAAALAASEAEARVRSSPPGSVPAPNTPRRPPPPPEARASPEAGSGDGADVLAALQGGHPPQKRKYKTGRTQDRTKEWEDHELFGRDEFTAEAFEAMEALEAKTEAMREILEDAEGVEQMKREGAYTIAGMEARGVPARAWADYFEFAKFLYECGDYEGARDMLDHYLALVFPAGKNLDNWCAALACSPGEPFAAFARRRGNAQLAALASSRPRCC